MNDSIRKSVQDVLDSGYLTEGPVTKKLEQLISKYTSVRHAIAVTNCTVGLEIALRAINLQPGDEVIVPDYTYPATASAVAIAGGVPVIVDIDPKTMNIDYATLEKAITEKTRALIPVSLFGNPLDWQRLSDIKKRYNLWVIEDAACSLGAEYQGRKVGSLADISVFSMHPRKFITTGEGGIITTDNDDFAAYMDSFKHFGMERQGNREEIVFGKIGTNAKLSNVVAAIGVGQMEVIDDLLAERRNLADKYITLLSPYPAIELPQTTSKGLHSYQSFCVFVDNREKIMKRMREHGIEVQIGTYQLSKQPAFRDSQNCRIEGKMDGSSEAFMRCLTLPLYNGMPHTEQEEVVTTLVSLVNEHTKL